MMTSSLSSSSSSSLHRFNRRPPSAAAPTLSLLSVFSSSSSYSASASTAAPAPPSRKPAFKHRSISLVGISRQNFSPPLVSSPSLYSLSATFHRTPRLHGVAGREVAIVDESDGEDEFYDEEEEEEEEGDELEEEEVVDVDDVGGAGEVVVGGGDGGLMRLSVKEKKELASYANSLGKKLKSQLVGKSGVTESVGRSFVETLEANELLKIKIHRTCPGELDDVIKRLEMLTGSVVVGQIGRTVIIYRPSISKMKAEEEKKKQAKRIFRRREPNSRFAPLKSRATTRPPGRGYRGSSRPRV